MIETGFIGKSNAMKKLQKEFLRVAKSQKHIFIQGDKGVGKTTAASLLHAWSDREGKCIVLSPAASTEDDLKTFFERDTKNVATIVFEDLQDFSFLYQAKFARFLQNVPSRPFVQVIVTANKGLTQLRNDGRLLDDLYSRVKHFEEIEIPSLRERREDIPLLVEHFIKAACEGMNMELKAIDVNSLDFLVRREWTGNVAELKSVVESTVLTSHDGTLALPESLVNEQLQLESMVKNIRQKRAFPFDSSLSNLEKTLIEKALDVVDYNQTRAAEILNLSEANLRYRLRKFHILKTRKK